MRLCSYVVRKDRGLAPNPFWGYCTLALCTPNHMGIRAEKGDWFVGFTTKQRGNKLLFAMEVAEVLSFEGYFCDPRFQEKKPKKNGDWKQRCGDNMYKLNNQGDYEAVPSAYHNTPEHRAQDTKHPKVFIGQHFFYFGEKAFEIPAEYQELIWPRHGCKCRHNPQVVDRFLEWLQREYKPGIYRDSEPYDRLKSNRREKIPSGDEVAECSAASCE